MMERDLVTLENRELHVRVWNRGAASTVVCWHGLARSGADFETLGEALAARGYQVLAPDTPGRGMSQWAQDPAREYQLPVYAEQALALLDHYQVDRLQWVGTSMGGLLGIILASNPLARRLDRLVLNDIGPELPVTALRRIVDYVRNTESYPSLSAFEQRIRDVYAPFGPRDDQGWHQMAIEGSRRLPNGHFAPHYDPEIIGTFDETAPPVDLWAAFGAIQCPMLVIQGGQSDVLPDAIVARMQRGSPALVVARFDDCGHAPGLHLQSHLAPLLSFLDQPGSR
ncbi:alpha/beta fold hydrolase [Saccharospirillum impatiens]|uniref:alpha/beta fold hydrolase n=1 Tax=Saccharospirillum impatiens TaxID=169438 RepID=UPI0004068CE3|nr:alpha/beta hydrolase [Saccharospirillum impatiens]